MEASHAHQDARTLTHATRRSITHRYRPRRLAFPTNAAILGELLGRVDEELEVWEPAGGDVKAISPCAADASVIQRTEQSVEFAKETAPVLLIPLNRTVPVVVMEMVPALLPPTTVNFPTGTLMACSDA